MGRDLLEVGRDTLAPAGAVGELDGNEVRTKVVRLAV